MQEFSSGRYPGFVETNDALITGVRGIARRLSFFVSSGLTAKATKLAMPVSPSSILSRRPLLNPLPLAGEEANEKGNLQSLRERKHSNRYANFKLFDLLGRVNRTLFQSPTASLVSRHEVAIMYIGRTSKSLMMTSERMVIPTGRYTLGQLLCSLYKRGDRWMDELDDSHLMCTVNGQDARLFDTIKPGAEICISSRKSIFEA
jgi:hypothetical protein